MLYGLDLTYETDNIFSKHLCVKCFATINAIRKTHSVTSIRRTKETFSGSMEIWCDYKSTNLDGCKLCCHRNSLANGFLNPANKLASSASSRGTETDTGAASSSSLTTETVTDTASCTPLTDHPADPSYDFQNTHYDITQHTTQFHEASVTNIHLSGLGCMNTPHSDTVSSPLDTAHAALDYIDSEASTSHSTHTLTAETSINTPLVPIAESTPIKPTRPQTQDSSTSPMIKNNATLNHSLSLSTDTPLSETEERLNTALIRRKLEADPKRQTIICKTKGQPLVFQRVVKPRKSTDTVRTPTKRKRASYAEDFRSNIAGPSCSSSDSQLGRELKRVPIKRRQDIVANASVKQKIKIPRQKTLAIKEQLGLSWRKSRKQNNLLKQFGIQMENEKSVRELAREIVSDFVTVEKRTFVDGNMSDYEVPYGRIADLPRFVDWLLDSYDQQNMLTWRKGSIPKNEIWVKIGGDHGKNSLKFTLQIANISNPNAGNNTAVISVAAVRDSHDNMVRFLEGGLGDDLSALQSHCWRDKTIKVFLNGDYEFLCKMYGLSAHRAHIRACGA